MSHIYKSIFLWKFDYLQTIFLTPYGQKFVKYYKNLVIYYGNVVISQLKKGHKVLKSQLGISTSNFFIIVTNINFLQWNQHQNFVIALKEVKNNTFIILKVANIMIYQDLTSYIISYVLFNIHKQYNSLKDSQLFPQYTLKFTTTMGLPCAYQIKVSFI